MNSWTNFCKILVQNHIVLKKSLTKEAYFHIHICGLQKVWTNWVFGAIELSNLG